jgi:ABC-type transporter Mla MlaB component
MSRPTEPATAILVIAGPIAEGDVSGLCERLRAVARTSAAQVVVCDVRGLGADVRTVDALARLQLVARSLGCSIRLHRPSPELDALLSFLGLAEAVASVGRRGRQAEEREQPLGVEERVNRDDAPL